MTLLAIDTAAALCAACIYDETGQKELGRYVLELQKGHAEHVMAVIEAALSSADVSYSDLSAIAVSVGPGSFTGVRVGVAAARGLALALKIPAIAVSTLEALAAESRLQFPDQAILSINKASDMFAVSLYDGAGQEILSPQLLTLEEARTLATEHSAVLAGDRAALLGKELAGIGKIGATNTTADIAFFAKVAAAQGSTGQKPSPLYLRQPDAKPQMNFTLPHQ